MILPIELFDILIHILRHDKPTLSSIALTHSSLTSRAQQRIFYHITLGGERDDTDPTNSILLALVNPKHAHLLKYVHAFTLTNSLFRSERPVYREYVPNPLIPAFIDAIAPHLTSLDLIDFAPGWDHAENKPLRDSIKCLLSSTTLKHVGLIKVHNFPLALLRRTSSFTSLRLATPYPSYASIADNAIPPDAPPIYLDALDINFLGEIPCRAFILWILGESTPVPFLSVTRLRKFSINGTHTSDVAQSFIALLNACHKTLQYLSLGPDRFNFNPSNTIFPELSALRSLQYSTILTYNNSLLPVDSRPFDFLIHFLINVPSLNSLEELDIRVEFSWWLEVAEQFEQMDMTCWDIFIACLGDQVNNGRCGKLKNLSVGIATSPPDIVSAKDMFPIVEERFVGVLDSTTIQLELYDFVL